MIHTRNTLNTMISPFEFKSIRSLAIMALLVTFACQSPVRGQVSDGIAADDLSPKQLAAKQSYDESVAKGRELAKKCRNVMVRFYDGSLAESYEWKEQWPEVKEELSAHQLVMEKAAIDWFLECDEPSRELLQMASVVSKQVYDAGDMEAAYQLMTKIKRLYPGKDILLERRLALIGIKTNRFHHAAEFVKLADAKDAVDEIESQVDKNMFYLSPLLNARWQVEAETQKKEAEADDLPQIKFETSNGEVIVELFENEAPETVANFIQLVESGYYDNSIFAPVIANIVAQSGVYTRKPQPDYQIKNESRRQDARSHFVGSLTMTASENSDTSSASMFAITLLPNPDLDWTRDEEDELSQTVFGRVVSGIEHVRALPATVEIDPETEEQKPIKNVTPGVIEKVTVIRKRDHEYKFEKIKPEPTK